MADAGSTSPPSASALDSPVTPATNPLPSSPPTRARPSPLLSTLSRLSLAQSRPDLPEPPSLASRLRSISGAPLALFTGTSSSSSSLSETTTLADSSAASSLLPADLTTTLYPTLQTHGDGAWPVLVLSLAEARRVRGATDDELFDGVLRRLEPWVGEEGEGGYVLVVLAGGSGDLGAGDGGAAPARKMPSVPWWIWKYRRIPRKKNLKKLYIVHPSSFTKAALPLLLPIVSPKSYPKLHIASSLAALGSHLSLRGVDVTLPLLLDEARAVRAAGSAPSAARRFATVSAFPPAAAEEAAPRPWSYATISGALASASSYLRGPLGTPDPPRGPGEYGGRVTDLAPGGTVCAPLVDLARVVLTECAGTEGIFRRSCLPQYQSGTLSLLSLPQDRQPALPLAELASADPLLPPALIKRLLADLDQPVVPAELYPLIRLTSNVADLRQLLETLPLPTHAVLAHVTHLAHHLLPHEPATKMSATALAIVLAPTLIASDPISDAEMCLEPGKALPSALRGMGGAPRAETEGTQTLVGLLAMWIDKYAEVAGGQGPCECPWGRGEVEVVREKKGARRHTLLGSAGKRASVASVATGP